MIPILVNCFPFGVLKSVLMLPIIISLDFLCPFFLTPVFLLWSWKMKITYSSSSLKMSLLFFSHFLFLLTSSLFAFHSLSPLYLVLIICVHLWCVVVDTDIASHTNLFMQHDVYNLICLLNFNQDSCLFQIDLTRVCFSQIEISPFVSNDLIHHLATP